MIKKYIKSQTGAALILILLAVLFVSIAGTALLTTTTYSLKSIENNEDVQAEFYAAEGALDLALYDITQGKDLPPSYNIGNKEVSVEIEQKPDSITVLTANYKTDTNIARELEVKISEPIGSTTSHAILYASLDANIDLINAEPENTLKKVDNIYGILKTYFTNNQTPIPLDDDDFNKNAPTEIGEDSLQGKVYVYNKDLEMKTHEDLIVKANNVLIIDGQLYQKGQAILKVEQGALVIVKNLKIGNGNNAINEINGALVADSITSQGNGNGVGMNVKIGVNAGLLCNLIDSLVDFLFDNISDPNILKLLGLNSLSDLFKLLGFNHISGLLALLGLDNLLNHLGLVTNDIKELILDILNDLGLSGCATNTNTTLYYEILDYRTK